MTRVDDIINTAGHRISTGRLEEVINDHDDVVESAVVGYNDEIRGECPLAYVVLKNGLENLSSKDYDKLKKEINGKVREDVGAFCRLEGVIFIQKLPKTRSGKILRGTIRKITNREDFKMPATIDDPSALDLIKSERDKLFSN
jgi:propionyl-CoA synthetase